MNGTGTDHGKLDLNRRKNFRQYVSKYCNKWICSIVYKKS